MSAFNRNWIKGRWFILSLVDILFSFSSRYCSCSPFQKHSASCWVNEINTNILYSVGFDFFLCLDSSLYFIFIFFSLSFFFLLLLFLYLLSVILTPWLVLLAHICYVHFCSFMCICCSLYLFHFHFVRATKVLAVVITTTFLLSTHIWIGCLIWFIWPIFRGVNRNMSLIFSCAKVNFYMSHYSDIV